jgi:FlaG/FlaF family flagellin (archaellin)
VRVRRAIAIVAVGAANSTFACSRSSTTSAGGNDGGDATAPIDSAPIDSAPIDSAADATEAASPHAYARLAHWSPDAPAVDVCLAAQGTSFSAQAPQLAALGSAVDASADANPGDGGAAGLVFPRVTSYFVVPPGSYTVRLVAAGAASCDTAIAELPSVPLDDGSYTTIAAVGELIPVLTDPPLKLVSFADDASAPSGQIALRFVNASPSMTAVDMGTNSIANAMFSDLFANVGFGQAGGAAGSDAGRVDADGYLASNPFSGATLSAHASQTATDAAIANDVTIDPGSAATVALIDGVTNGAAAELLLCADGDASIGVGGFSRCTVLSQ